VVAGLKQLNPDASKKELWYLWARKHLGRELFEKVYGDVFGEKAVSEGKFCRDETTQNKGLV